MNIKVAIVEDERSIRENLALLIDGTKGLRCLGAYRTAEEAIKHLSTGTPDVVLIDLNLPQMSGVECVRRLRALLPDLKIIVLTKYEDADHIFQALKSGANGYLLKKRPPSELLEAILEVDRGYAPMSSEVAARVVAYFHQHGRGLPEMSRLSPRETEILGCLAKGFLYKEIADTLHITYQTVNGHIKNIYQKLHVRSRTEAVAKYLRK